jgi:hypothetical protein
MMIGREKPKSGGKNVFVPICPLQVAYHMDNRGKKSDRPRREPGDQLSDPPVVEQKLKIRNMFVVKNY